DDHQVLSLGRFDLIVSNPPFFIDSMKSPFNQRNKARHSDSLPFETLIKNAIRLLNDHGKFCLILPTREAEVFTTLAARQQLFPEKICDIFPYPDSPFNRKMISFQRQQVSPHHESLYIRNHDRSYSNEYLMLTKDFYLNLEEQQQKQ
ncbi:MAG: hypothetical protein PHR53_06345, partial [Bacteroidales bacterium]|nr:hypothetical protein [Bacteroidales bacterium]